MREIQTGLSILFLIGAFLMLIGAFLMLIGAGFFEQSQFSSDELGKPQRTKTLHGKKAIQTETPTATSSRLVPPTPAPTATDTPWAFIPPTCTPWHLRSRQGKCACGASVLCHAL